MLRLWLTILFPYSLGFFITSIFRSVNAILATPLEQTLHLNPMEVGFVTSTYVLAFALAQVPLGICLDHWGPRKTQTLFFSIGGIGIILFGFAPGVALLAIGRAILGIGMAGGLMSAFKAISEWFEKEKIPFYNGIILAAGGIGVLVATTPSKLFEIQFGWRALSILFGIFTFLIALLIFLLCHDKPMSEGEGPTLKERIRGLELVYQNRFFWQVTPIFSIALGGYIAMQGLWLGPWLEHVVGLSELESANYLLWNAVAMVFGVLSGGLYSALAKKVNTSLHVVVVIGIIIHIVTQILVVSNLFSHNIIIWLIYSYFSQTSMIFYAVIAQHFGPELSGRAMTAVNMIIFLVAFFVQYLFGLVIHFWPSEVDSIHAYQTAFSGLILLECLALIWYYSSSMLGRRRSRFF